MAVEIEDSVTPAAARAERLVLPEAGNKMHLPEAGKLTVFISYSRTDLAFADQLDATLKIGSFETTIDRHGIHAGEDWKAQLGAIIRDCDTVVFVLTPNSAASEICHGEVAEAGRVGNRIMPVVPGPLDGATPPPKPTPMRRCRARNNDSRLSSLVAPQIAVILGHAPWRVPRAQGSTNSKSVSTRPRRSNDATFAKVE